MPAIPSFINNYRPGWKAKAVIKSSLSRFNRTESPVPPPSDVAQTVVSPAISTILDITDDSSLDFDGGQPNEFENDIIHRISEPTSSRPSDVSSSSPPAKLEITLPPELRIDWFAERFADRNKGGRGSSLDSLDQDTKDTLAGKIKDDQGLVETLEAALARHVESNPSHLFSIPGLDLQLPEMSPSSKRSPGPLTIPDYQLDVALRNPSRDSLSMLTSRLSIGDTPASSALSGTTLARALISNTFALPVDRLSEVGLTRTDSTVLPRDTFNMFSIAPDAPPLPPDAETLYVAPKRSRAERRKQMKRRSSTGNLNSKTLLDPPTTSHRTSLILSASSSPNFDFFSRSPRSLSPGSPPEHSSLLPPIPDIIHESPTLLPSVLETTSPVTPPTHTKSDTSLTLPPLPEGVRRLPDPRSQSSAGVSPAVSTKSSTPSKEIDTKGLEDVLEYYNLGESPGPLIAGATFRPGVSPIREETSSQLSPEGSPFRNDRRDSKRVPPAGARSPRSRSESISMQQTPDTRLSPRQTPLPSPPQNELFAENTGSSKTPRSFEPQRSDSGSSHSHSTRNPSRQGTRSIPLASPSGSPCLREVSHHEASRSAADDAASAHMGNSGRAIQSDGNCSLDPTLNILPLIPTPPIFNQPASPFPMETHQLQSEFPPSPGVLPAASVSSPPVRSHSLPTGSPVPTNLVVSTTSPDNVGTANGDNLTIRAVEEGPGPVSDPQLIPPHLYAYKDEFLPRTSTFSMGSPPPYYEVVSQAHMHAGPPMLNADYAGSATSVAGPSTSDHVAGLSRWSGEWGANDPSRDSPARTRTRPRPPLPIGPRRPSQAGPVFHSNIPFPDSRTRSGSMVSSSQQHGLSRQPSASGRITAIPSPKFQTPPPKWRGHTMDAARWTFKSGQLQAIVSKAIKESSEASLIRLLEPEVLDNDLPKEITTLETLRTDIKTRYKLLARRRAIVFDALSSFIGSNNNNEGRSAYAHRLLEELSEIAAALDYLSEELHSADTQLAHLESLTQVHMSSALAVAIRKLNTSFLKQTAENENLRNELFSVEAERDEAWRQAERIAVELDQLGTLSDSPSPIPNVSNRSSYISAHRKSKVIASKTGLKIAPAAKPIKRRFSKLLSLNLSPSSAFGTSFVPSSCGSSSKGLYPPGLPPRMKPPFPESALLSHPTLPTSIYTPSYSATKALNQAQDELYAMLGLTVPQTSIRHSRSWEGLTVSSPREIFPASRRHSVFLTDDLLQQPGALVTRRSSLPSDSTLAQVSNAMAADRNAMLVTFDMLSGTEPNDETSQVISAYS